MSSIVLEVVTVDGGGELVLTPERRIKSALSRFRSKINELQTVADEMARAIESPKKSVDVEELKAAHKKKLEEIAAYESEAEANERTAKLIREKCEGKVQTVEYPFRPYTDGEKQDALSEATSYESGTPRVDLVAYHRKLASICLGVTELAIRNMSPARATALIAEVIERSEPDPLRLDFLS